MCNHRRCGPDANALLRGAGVSALTLLVGTGTAWAQAGGGPISPAVSPVVRLGDLRSQLQAYQPGQLPRSTGPAWLISPSIGVDVGVTDNVFVVDRPRKADVFTLISPAVVVSGDTARLKVNVAYTPRIAVYASTSEQTRVDQFFNGSALAAIVPETVFLDVRGSISQQSRAGGFANSDQTLNRRDQVQSISFSATPYAEHRFGGWGTGRVGYSIARTLQNGREGDNVVFNQGSNQNGQFFGTPFGNTGNLTTQRERASFVTGENLGRINNISVLEAVQYNGSGPYRGAYRNTVSTDFGYAITRNIILLGGTGYQDLKFSGSPGVRINEPIWNVGVRLLPNADSSITVGYGRRDGANSVYLDGSYSPTVRTRIFARYSTGITTDSEEQQNLLQASSVGPTGLVTDSVTGAPVGSTSDFFGTQNGLFRLRRFSASGFLLLNRDSISLSVVNEQRTNLSSVAFDPNFSALNSSIGNVVVLPPGSSTSGTYGTVSWQHELSPVLTSTASFQYGVQSVGQNGSGGSQPSTRTLSVTAGLGYQFTETLTGSARYSFTERSGGYGQPIFGTTNGNGSVIENQVLVGLRKSF